MTLVDERMQWEQDASITPLPDDIVFNEEKISGVRCLWATQENSTSSRVIVYLHGGGLIAGSAITHQHFAAAMTKACKVPVLLVDYRLLPENEYPAPLEDALSVYESLLSEPRFSDDQIVLAGDSSGGGLILAALVQLKEAGAPLPYCSFIVSGAFDMTLSGESMQDNTCDDPTLSYDELLKWRNSYLLYDLESPLLSPLFADLSELPPILLIAGGKDPWLSDSLKAAQKIENAKGKVQLRVWNTMGHVWVLDSSLDETAEAMNEICSFISTGNF